MSDDESGVGDGICCEGGCVLASHRGAQPLGRLADGMRERGVLLNVPEVLHRVSVPWWVGKPCKPRFGRESHGAPRTDSRFPVVAVLLRGLRCRELLFNQHRWSHWATPFRWLNPCTVRRWPL